MRLKQEVDVGSKLYSLPGRHGQESVVIQDRVQGLDPLRVDVAVAHDPRLHFSGFLHHLPGASCQHTVSPLPCVQVDVSQKLVMRLKKKM